MSMTDLDEFLAVMVPRMKAADTALHNGDATDRIAMWSHDDPITLFGAALSGSGWSEIGPVFDKLAASFSNCTSAEIDVLAAGVSEDLAYVVSIEHTRVSIGGAPTAYSLRVTTIFRREHDEWKVVHRHADPYESADSQVVSRLQQGETAGR
jgi:ketosteroid isomerase-like protein